MSDYEEYQELKKKKETNPARIDGCLMVGCKDFNYFQDFVKSNYIDYKLISLDYGGVDVFKAKLDDGSDIIFFGQW
ncbi:MAG TPA: hypothetical protein VNR38_00800 [Ureibacillus sp.]|nr:hypothetical protein [Ureibacillus sp.]